MKKSYLVFFIGVKVMSDNLLKLYNMEELKNLLLRYAIYILLIQDFLKLHGILGLLG